jgi:2-dehydro-3-deoxygluconokinase
MAMREGGPVLCFGEMLLRLSAPGKSHLLQDARFDAHIGGAEANVAAALARIGHPSALVTALPDDALGDAAVEAMRAAGVDVSRVLRGPGRLGLYYLMPGAGPRAASIIYDRVDSLFAKTPARAYDWPVLLDGMKWLHLSGITPAIAPGSATLSLGAIAAAKAAGVRVSFDGNFRGSMWARWCADPAPILAGHVAGADLLFGNHRDIGLMLGKEFDGESPEGRRAAALAAFDTFPELQVIASTVRVTLSPDHNRMRARIDTPNASHETDEIDIAGIVDRIGTGDAFAAGVLAGLDDGLEAAARMGLHLAALKHATPGDQSRTSRRDLEAFDPGAGLDIRR